jgi:UDP-N-acetylmuramate--alanine ligase
VVKCRQELFGAFETRLPGVHNVSNSLAAIAVGSILGLPKEAIREAVSQFQGVRRRFELLGQAAGITVMDDYAHHPTEVRATLAAARERFPRGRLVCLFQPHTYSRSRYLLEGFRTCFEGGDVLLIAETYAAREEPSAGMSARELAAAMERPAARYVGGLEEAAQAVLQVLQPGDVFFTIGAGDVDKVAHLILQELQRP